VAGAVGERVAVSRHNMVVLAGVGEVVRMKCWGPCGCALHPLPRRTPLELHREEPRRRRPVGRFAAAPARMLTKSHA
jgi:hypothetical protein